MTTLVSRFTGRGGVVWGRPVGALRIAGRLQNTRLNWQNGGFGSAVVKRRLLTQSYAVGPTDVSLPILPSE